MDIGVFGIDPASKFATEKCKIPKGKLALAGTAVVEDSLPGSGQLSGRVARGSTFRKAPCGSAFRLFFSYRARPCRPAHLARRHHMGAMSALPLTADIALAYGRWPASSPLSYHSSRGTHRD